MTSKNAARHPESICSCFVCDSQGTLAVSNDRFTCPFCSTDSVKSEYRISRAQLTTINRLSVRKLLDRGFDLWDIILALELHTDLSEADRHLRDLSIERANCSALDQAAIESETLRSSKFEASWDSSIARALDSDDGSQELLARTDFFGSFSSSKVLREWLLNETGILNLHSISRYLCFRERTIRWYGSPASNYFNTLESGLEFDLDAGEFASRLACFSDTAQEAIFRFPDKSRLPDALLSSVRFDEDIQELPVVNELECEIIVLDD